MPLSFTIVYSKFKSEISETSFFRFGLSPFPIFISKNSVIIEKYGRSYKLHKRLNLNGITLLDALTFSTDPFYYDLTGKTENIRVSKHIVANKRDMSNTRGRNLIMAKMLRLVKYYKRCGNAFLVGE